jgi:PHD/YefM family antitoxin component YafN of YafNO toxin-antitoxin module
MHYFQGVKQQMTILEAQDAIDEILDAIEEDPETRVEVLDENGTPIAVFVSPDSYETFAEMDKLLDSENQEELLEEGHSGVNDVTITGDVLEDPSEESDD